MRISVVTLALAGLVLALGVMSSPLLAQGAGTDRSGKAPRTVVRSVSVLERGGGETEVIISATAPFKAVPFELLSPPRTVIDIANMDFALPKSPDDLPGGLIKRYRFGALGSGRGRIVLDTRERAAIVRQSKRQRAGRHELRLILKSKRAQAQAATPPPVPRLRPSKFAPRERRERAKSRPPIVVIDPGHGGTDPGAVTAGGVTEKTIALSVARRLAARLRKQKRYQIIMTRKTDTFVALDERVRISEDAEADLFISLHADAVGDQSIANAVRGATVYTVSDRASDEVARALADKENAADERGGIVVGRGQQSEAVRSILFDLMRRESTDRAARFREHLISRLGKSIALSRSPRRAAAFKVLKQVKTPAVLIELGYMSNAKDQALMQSTKWQTSVARAIADAVALQFDRR